MKRRREKGVKPIGPAFPVTETHFLLPLECVLSAYFVKFDEAEQTLELEKPAQRIRLSADSFRIRADIEKGMLVTLLVRPDGVASIVPIRWREGRLEAVPEPKHGDAE